MAFLYTFLIGTAFNMKLLDSRTRTAASVSAAGILAPFALGGVLALWLREVPGLFAVETTPFEAILFLGSAMSITAFPMLARIVYERGLSDTPPSGH